MAIESKKRTRECTDFGRIDIPITGSDVGSQVEFAGILAGFTIIGANVTVTEAFANADNTISVGIDGDLTRFVAATAVNSLVGAAFTNKQYKADKTTAVYANVAGTASATGKATVSIMYAKHAVSRIDY